MKALILNSGIGRRMGDLTLSSCKCMAPLQDDVTILDNQLRLLIEAGVSEFVITTGPFAEELEDYVTRRYGEAGFRFEHNPLYQSTNYIYSIYLARHHLHDDLLLLHGDLVFEREVLRRVLAAERSVMVADPSLPLPEKDFKAEIRDGRILRVGVDVFENAVAVQPLYKLRRPDWELWLKKIEEYCETDRRNVYAENAFNDLCGALPLYPQDVTGFFCGEIDTPEDLARVREAFENFAGTR